MKYTKQCILLVRVSNVIRFSNAVYRVCKRMIAIQMCNTLSQGCLKIKFLFGPQIILVRSALPIWWASIFICALWWIFYYNTPRQTYKKMPTIRMYNTPWTNELITNVLNEIYFLDIIYLLYWYLEHPNLRDPLSLSRCISFGKGRKSSHQGSLSLNI